MHSISKYRSTNDTWKDDLKIVDFSSSSAFLYRWQISPIHACVTSAAVHPVPSYNLIVLWHPNHKPHLLLLGFYNRLQKAASLWSADIICTEKPGKCDVDLNSASVFPSHQERINFNLFSDQNKSTFKVGFPWWQEYLSSGKSFILRTQRHAISHLSTWFPFLSTCQNVIVDVFDFHFHN